jgi:hypothetical protein
VIRLNRIADAVFNTRDLGRHLTLAVDLSGGVDHPTVELRSGSEAGRAAAGDPKGC